MGSSSNMSKRTAAVTALCILSSCLNPVNARCSHDVAERGLEQHKRIVAARESMELEKRQSPIDEAQERTELSTSDAFSFFLPNIPIAYAS